MPILDPLIWRIIGFHYRVSNILGHGFMEKVYEARGPERLNST